MNFHSKLYLKFSQIKDPGHIRLYVSFARMSNLKLLSNALSASFRSKLCLKFNENSAHVSNVNVSRITFLEKEKKKNEIGLKPLFSLVTSCKNFINYN